MQVVKAFEVLRRGSDGIVGDMGLRSDTVGLQLAMEAGDFSAFQKSGPVIIDSYSGEVQTISETDLKSLISAL